MQTNKRCVIVGAAPIKNYTQIKQYIKQDDTMVYCDGGLQHLDQLGIKPELIVGDFDSFPAGEAGQYQIETITLPRAKDDTDTMYAAKEMLKMGYRRFLLLGVIGGRFDHSMANLALLLFLYQQGCEALIIDDFAEYEIVGETSKIITEAYPYFSLLAINGEARGISIKGAKFPLTDGHISPSAQYAVSNEVLPKQIAIVSVKQGELLLMRLFHG